MRIEYGKGETKYGPGVRIELSGDELAAAVGLYLHAKEVVVRGPRTISYDDRLLEDRCVVYVDPSGFVITPDGKKLGGERGGDR